jgi:hypothetical protein
MPKSKEPQKDTEDPEDEVNKISKFKSLLKKALTRIADDDRDRANVENGIGFSRDDTDLGHELAEKDETAWNDHDIEDAFRLVQYYHKKQVDPELWKRIKKIRNDLKDEGEDGAVKIDTGQSVYFRDFQKVPLAQGFANDIMYISVPLWFDIEKKDDDSGEIISRKRMLSNFVVLSDGRIIKPYDRFFQELNLVPEIPEAVLPLRWSMESIQRFHEDHSRVNPISVFSRLKDTWNSYMDLSGNPGADTALPLFNMLSYCVQLFQYAPYLKYEGEKGAAKSKACEIHELVDFNAIYGTNYTPADMFRTLDDMRGTLIIDEAENYGQNGSKSDYDLAREQIINLGFKKNGTVSRRDDYGKTRRTFHVFGIKIFGSIGSVSETIRDRAYQITLLKTGNREISKRTPRTTDPRWQQIRDDLYLLVLNYWQEIKELADSGNIENRLDLISRDYDKALPLIVLATFFDSHDKDKKYNVLDNLWTFLQDQQTRAISLTLDTFDQVVVDVIEEDIGGNLELQGILEPDDRDVRLELRDVAAKIATREGKNDRSPRFNLRSYSHSIKSKLEKLGLGKDFKPGSKNKTKFVTSLKMVRDTRKRYGIAGNDQNADKSFNPINLTNFINSINSFNQSLDSGLIEVNRFIEEKKSINPHWNLHNIESLIKRLNGLIELIESARVNGKNENHDPLEDDREVDDIL